MPLLITFRTKKAVATQLHSKGAITSTLDMINGVNIKAKTGNMHVDKTSPIQAHQYEGAHR